MENVNFESIEFEGEKYIKIHNQWLDSSFLVPPMNILRKIIEYEIQQIDINSLGIEQLKKYIDGSKKSECFDICLRLTDRLIYSAMFIKDIKTIKYYISVKCSCLRKLTRPIEVIEFCKEMKYDYSDDILDIATLTSLAAAYCDIEDWTKAKQTCNFAYKKQSGGVGYANELSMVYKRIEANLK